MLNGLAYLNNCYTNSEIQTVEKKNKIKKKKNIDCKKKLFEEKNAFW